MKYEKPILHRLNSVIKTACSAGSSAGCNTGSADGSWGNCIAGPSVGGNCYTNGTAPAGNLCGTGSENQGSCTTGNVAENCGTTGSSAF